MDIRNAVESELIFDPLVDETDIKVKNMNGEVALNGTVPSYPQYLEAAAAAQRIAGVKNVHNHLEVVLPPGDYRDNAAADHHGEQRARAEHRGYDDSIEATARNGNLTLTGTVSSGSQRAAAELAVAGLTGVRNIKNEIEIVYDAYPVDVTLAVQDALDRYALIPYDNDVVVEISANTVTLSGHVRTWAEHDAVVTAAWMANGSSRSTTTFTSADRQRIPTAAS